MIDFESLATAHKDAVYRQMVRACGNHQDAEDVLVEALSKAYQGLDQLHDSSNSEPGSPGLPSGFAGK